MNRIGIRPEQALSYANLSLPGRSWKLKESLLISPRHITNGNSSSNSLNASVRPSTAWRGWHQYSYRHCCNSGAVLNFHMCLESGPPQHHYHHRHAAQTGDESDPAHGHGVDQTKIAFIHPLPAGESMATICDLHGRNRPSDRRYPHRLGIPPAADLPEGKSHPGKRCPIWDRSVRTRPW